ncbi:MAG: YheC/YheD family protein [Syntrophomonadaceae bacterium]|jgi:glutathione synthase/RimK-type ligase-like ATP-grasp enzyme|nr:YheC/YheD family protein [Syntrophomonadaceae bacterium]
MRSPSGFSWGKREVSFYNNIAIAHPSFPKKLLAVTANKITSQSLKKSAFIKNDTKRRPQKRKNNAGLKPSGGSSFNYKTAIIGILATKFRHNSFGIQDVYFRQLINNIYQSGGIGYVFTGQNIDWKRRLVYGYYLEDAGINWLERWFPMPDVCYDRSFHETPQTSIKNLAKLMQKKGIKIFNTSIGDKLKVYKTLASYPDVAEYQPDTRLLRSGALLKSMLNKYREVYVKPLNGTKGRGVFKVTMENGNNQYHLRRSGSSQSVFRNDIAQIWSAIYRKHTVKMLVQAGIKNPGLGEHFDLRVLVQKDARNQWHITAKAARLGCGGSVTTNIHTGGVVKELDAILRERGLTSKEINVINKNIIWLTLRIAEILDHSSVAIGELGLDFIIDEYLKVWFIEANRKPGRQILDIMGAEAKNTSFMRPVEYALYLSGKPYGPERSAPAVLTHSAPD